jgi:outer membrane protein assembly factor BamB
MVDFGFEGFESSDFDAELEEFELVKTRKMDRNFRIGQGGSIMATPLVTGGIGYFGSADNHVYAVDAETGKEKWRFRTHGQIFSTPAVDGNMVFVGSYDRNLYALSIEGKEAWRFTTGGEIASTPKVHGGLVFVGSKDGYIYALDKRTGECAWKFRTGDWIASSPEVWDGKMYIGSYDGNVYCISLEGRELWRFKTGAEIWALHQSGTVFDGTLYFSSMDGYLYAVDAITGKEKWKAKTGKYGNAIQPFVNERFVLQPSRDGILFAFSLEGEELWRFNLGNLPSGVTMHESMILIGNESGILRALSAEGEELWRFHTGGKIFGAPVLWKDRIIFGSYDCRLYAVDMQGQELWRFGTSNQTMVHLPPPHDAFELKVKKSFATDDTAEEAKYRKKKGEGSVSLSDYHISSEYATTSEYKTKSDYDVSFVMFEGALEGEEIWISDSRGLIRNSSMSSLKK